eukprot:555327-Rhodomonas_salina.3
MARDMTSLVAAYPSSDPKNTRIDTKTTRIDTKNTRIDTKNTRVDTKNTRISAPNGQGLTWSDPTATPSPPPGSSIR